ncbi:MAG: ABC-2 family transporter protein [Kouleothrix sp.]
MFTVGGAEASSYPLSIYNTLVRGIFLFMILVAFANYPAALYLLGRTLVGATELGCSGSTTRGSAVLRGGARLLARGCIENTGAWAAGVRALMTPVHTSLTIVLREIIQRYPLLVLARND